MQNILVPIDFSPVTQKILDQVSVLAKNFSSQVWLIHVVAPDPDFVGYAAGPQTVRDQRAKEIHSQHEELQLLAKKLEADGLKITPLLIQGPTVETILEQSKKLKSDLIVIGSHGHGALYRLLLGSVSEGVLKSAPCPLLIIPSKPLE